MKNLPTSTKLPILYLTIDIAQLNSHHVNVGVFLKFYINSNQICSSKYIKLLFSFSSICQKCIDIHFQWPK